MATISLTRKEAANKLAKAGIPKDIYNEYYIIKVLEALGLLHIKEETETLYEIYINDTHRTVTLLKRDNQIELWVGGKWRYNLKIDDV